MRRYGWIRLSGTLVTVTVLAGLLCSVDVVRSAVATGLKIAGGSLVPSLFVFSVAVQLVVRLRLLQPLEAWLAPVFQKLFGLSAPCVSAWLLGALGGYPIGAQVLASQVRQGSLDASEAESALGICNLCGAAFVVSVAAPVLGLSVGGACLVWAIHLIASLLTALLMRPFFPQVNLQREKQDYTEFPESFAAAFSASVLSAVNAMLMLTGMICLFQVLIALSEVILPSAMPLRNGFLELASGISALSYGDVTSAVALIGWGGCCVAAQTAAIVAPLKLRLRKYFAAKALQAAISVLLVPCVQSLLP